MVHQNGLLHRDVKPQNLILRQGTDQVILIDFGIAREFSPGAVQTHTSLVSPGYAPIEQYLPQEKRSPATDVYGLAATLYTLLTARIPAVSILRDRQPLREPKEWRADLSARVNQAVVRGMAVETQARPTSVDEWLQLLPDSQPASQPTPSATSQAATVAVIPQHQPVPQSAPTVVAGSPSFHFWHYLLIGGVAAIAAATVGALVARQPSTSPPSVAQPSPTSPSPAPTSEAATPTPETPSTPTPSVLPETPESTPPTEPEPPSPTSPETTSELEATPPAPSPSLPPDLAEPLPPEPLDEPAAEQQREAEKQAEEQQREAEKQEKEQAKEEAEENRKKD